MSKIEKTISEIHRMEDLAGRDQWTNRIHPLAKLAVTVIFLVADRS